MSEIQSENHRKTDIKSMDLAELKAFMTSIGEKPFRAAPDLISGCIVRRCVAGRDDDDEFIKGTSGKV